MQIEFRGFCIDIYVTIVLMKYLNKLIHVYQIINLLKKVPIISSPI